LVFTSSAVNGVTCNDGMGYVNNPLNLSLCISMSKSTHKHCPNGDIPCIVFDFGTDKKKRWYYDREEVRDAEFERLAERAY
jgi:hypothetical protein